MIDDKSTDSEANKKKQARVSAQFRSVCKRAKPGASILAGIKREDVSAATVRRWAKAGLISVTLGSPGRKDHHRSRPLASAILLDAGHAALNKGAEA